MAGSGRTATGPANSNVTEMIPNPSSRPDRSAVARSRAPSRCLATAPRPGTSRSTRKSSSEERLWAQAVTAPTEPSASMAAPCGQLPGGNQISSTQKPAMHPPRSSAPARHNGVWYRTAIA